jgi:hypothetical protein
MTARIDPWTELAPQATSKVQATSTSFIGPSGAPVKHLGRIFEVRSLTTGFDAAGAPYLHKPGQT